MKRTNYPTVAKAIIVAVFMSMMPGYSAMANTVAENTASYQQVAGDYESLKTKLNAFMDKVKQSKKDDLPALVDEAKALKAEIIATDLTDEQKEEMHNLFNAIIEQCKKLN